MFSPTYIIYNYVYVIQELISYNVHMSMSLYINFSHIWWFHTYGNIYIYVCMY